MKKFTATALVLLLTVSCLVVQAFARDVYASVTVDQEGVTVITNTGSNAPGWFLAEENAIADFAGARKQPVINYFPEEVRSAAAKMVSCDVTTLEASGMVAMNAEGYLPGNGDADAVLNIESLFESTEDAIIVVGFRNDDGTVDWTALEADVEHWKYVFTIPQDCMTRMSENICAAVAIGPVPSGGPSEKAESHATPSKSAADMYTATVGGDAALIIYINKTIDNWYLETVAGISAQVASGTPVANCFGDAIHGQIAAAIANPDEAVAYETVTIECDYYKTSLGAIPVSLGFPTTYDNGQVLSVVLGFFEGEGPVLWYALDGKAVNGDVAVTLPVPIMQRMNQEEAAMIIVSDPKM